MPLKRHRDSHLWKPCGKPKGTPGSLNLGSILGVIIKKSANGFLTVFFGCASSDCQCHRLRLDCSFNFLGRRTINGHPDVRNHSPELLCSRRQVVLIGSNLSGSIRPWDRDFVNAQRWDELDCSISHLGFQPSIASTCLTIGRCHDFESWRADRPATCGECHVDHVGTKRHECLVGSNAQVANSCKFWAGVKWFEDTYIRPDIS